MSENPVLPGALGFASVCTTCGAIQHVRSDGEVFRWLRHRYPSTWYASDQDCPMSDAKWEPTPAGQGFTNVVRDTKGWVK